MKISLKHFIHIHVYMVQNSVFIEPRCEM